MLKKSVICRVLLLVAVIGMVNLYFGCVHKHYAPGSQYQTKEGAKLDAQEKFYIKFMVHLEVESCWSKKTKTLFGF